MISKTSAKDFCLLLKNLLHFNSWIRQQWQALALINESATGLKPTIEGQYAWIHEEKLLPKVHGNYKEDSKSQINKKCFLRFVNDMKFIQDNVFRFKNHPKVTKKALLNLVLE